MQSLGAFTNHLLAGPIAQLLDLCMLPRPFPDAPARITLTLLCCKMGAPPAARNTTTTAVCVQSMMSTFELASKLQHCTSLPALTYSVSLAFAVVHSRILTSWGQPACMGAPCSPTLYILRSGLFQCYPV